MANQVVSLPDSFANSPFGVMRKNRNRRGKIYFPPPNTRENERVFNLMMEHLFLLCRRAGAGRTTDPAGASERVFGQRLTPSSAWSALIEDFETVHAGLVAAEEPIRLSIAFARGRIYAMGRDERVALKRAMTGDAANHRSQQYAAERAANGGEIEFFNSNSWQRVRFEVLADCSGCCQLCGRSYREHGVMLEVDHIKPRSRFPSLALDKSNLQVMCHDCNRGKSNRDTTDWRATPANDDPQEEVA